VIDTKSRIILGRCATQAIGTAEREAALALIQTHERRRTALGLKQAVEIATADAGLSTTA
jgi:hypothetical protein